MLFRMSKYYLKLSDGTQEVAQGKLPRFEGKLIIQGSEVVIRLTAFVDVVLGTAINRKSRNQRYSRQSVLVAPKW